ncbi:MAG: GNAT family N-acetyltransferase [Bacteriovorax sp.]|nr:GNAT family N-acetyltransferase [Bacteriovorax sp.]
MTLFLTKPDIKYKASFFAGLAEMTKSSERFSWNYLVPEDVIENDFTAYVQHLLKLETHPPVGFVPDTVYWAILKDEIIGRISLRHELNDFLKQAGGNIGYIVRPSQRSKGSASEMLRQLLLTDRAFSIGKLLLTCDEGNIGSEKTILKNGGLFEKTLLIESDKTFKKHFWINLNRNH